MTPGGSYNPHRTTPVCLYIRQVWADPVSLATTQGIAVAFFSSGYLDVSVPPVISSYPIYSGMGDGALPPSGSPIRKSPDQSLFGGSPKLIAAHHVLPRLPSPRHPPYALSSLTVENLFNLCAVFKVQRNLPPFWAVNPTKLYSNIIISR